jgi:hypothetical protein
MFIINWMFDKLGYMPKIDMQVGRVNIEAIQATWPFPEVEIKSLAEEPVPIKKPAAKKPVARKTTRAKKVK